MQRKIKLSRPRRDNDKKFQKQIIEDIRVTNSILETKIIYSNVINLSTLQRYKISNQRKTENIRVTI